MKKTITAIVALVCALTMFTACGNNSVDREELESLRAENESLKAQQTAEIETTTNLETTTTAEVVSDIDSSGEWDATYNDCSMRFEEANLVYDYDDNLSVVVKMTFRNDSDKACSCGFTFAIDAYQDGVECDSAILWGETSDTYDTGTNTTEIKPGVEFTVYKAYKLRNDASDVVVEVRGLYDFDKNILCEQTYYL